MTIPYRTVGEEEELAFVRFARSVGSTVPRRQLGRYLQQLRGESNLSVQRVSEELSCSVQKIWRIEVGLTAVRTPDVKALCEVYRATPEFTALLVDLAGQGSPAGWWQPEGEGVPDWFEPYLVLESSAEWIRHYDGELPHSLLQTVAYMTDAMRLCRPDLDGAGRRRRVELRQQRQKLLDRSAPTAPRLEFIVSEAVLLRPVADRAVMAEQLHHLALLNERPYLSVRVLPLAAGPHPGSVSGAFALLDFPRPRRQDGELPVVYQEGPTGGLYLDRPADIAHYESVWGLLDKLALSADDSTLAIKSAAAEYE